MSFVSCQRGPAGYGCAGHQSIAPKGQRDPDGGRGWEGRHGELPTPGHPFLFPLRGQPAGRAKRVPGAAKPVPRAVVVLESSGCTSRGGTSRLGIAPGLVVCLQLFKGWCSREQELGCAQEGLAGACSSLELANCLGHGVAGDGAEPRCGTAGTQPCRAHPEAAHGHRESPWRGARAGLGGGRLCRGVGHAGESSSQCKTRHIHLLGADLWVGTGSLPDRGWAGGAHPAGRGQGKGTSEGSPFLLPPGGMNPGCKQQMNPGRPSSLRAAEAAALPYTGLSADVL